MNKHFSTALRKELSENWRSRPFTAHDFDDLAKEYDTTTRSTSQLLRDLTRSNKVYECGLIPHPHGGSPTKQYRITKGADMSVTTKQQAVLEAKRRLSEKEVSQEKAAARLSNCLNILTRKRMTA